MERRKAIKNIGLTFGAFVATPTALSLLQSCGSSEAPWTATFYDINEAKVIKNFVEMLLPASGNLPSAVSINVHGFIDGFVNQAMVSKDQINHRNSLKKVIADLLATAGKEKIGNLDDDDYDKFMNKVFQMSFEEAEELDRYIEDYLDKNDDDPRGLDAKIRIYAFMKDFRDMCIWAYQNNETVGETIMAYVSVPGKQEGCVDLQATTGGKAWSLTW